MDNANIKPNFNFITTRLVEKPIESVKYCLQSTKTNNSLDYEKAKVCIDKLSAAFNEYQK